MHLPDGLTGFPCDQFYLLFYLSDPSNRSNFFRWICASAMDSGKRFKR
jgi:hypothetical protein